MHKRYPEFHGNVSRTCSTRHGLTTGSTIALADNSDAGACLFEGDSREDDRQCSVLLLESTAAILSCGISAARVLHAFLCLNSQR